MDTAYSSSLSRKLPSPTSHTLHCLEFQTLILYADTLHRLHKATPYPGVVCNDQGGGLRWRCRPDWATSGAVLGCSAWLVACCPIGKHG